MTSKFGHHYNPGMDFIMEVMALSSMHLTPEADKSDLRARIERAMGFRVGGYPETIAAKETLRRLEAETADLGPETARLIRDFTAALRAKLVAAEAKYGRRDDWLRDDWENECRRKMHDHIAKGDPLDVAAYCAFMWGRKWSTAEPERTPESA